MHLANKGIKVHLYDMKPHKMTEAHHCGTFAELVCSNSLKADRIETSSGMLKAEMRKFGSLILDTAEITKVPAGGALAVDRTEFSKHITKIVSNHENITVINEEVDSINLDEYTIIATGPLTSGKLAEHIKTLTGENALSFFDAAAPIIDADSIDMDKVFAASRYNKGDADYLNCPLNKEQYEKFHTELINAETAELKEFEKESFKVYEGCMPVETMGKRGVDTLRYGPLKPVGIYDPVTDIRPWAVVQLRKENVNSSMYNLVGFQTNLKFSEQKRVFAMITGLENATFHRFGVMHRNTFIDSPKLLNRNLSMKKHPKLFFAGQITGVEGYVESAMCGIMAGYYCEKDINNLEPVKMPNVCMIEALLNYITDEQTTNFQPMSANMGILPPLENRIKDKKVRYAEIAKRSLDYLNSIEL